MTQEQGSPGSDSRYAEVLRQGFPRLRFPEPLESEFRAVHVADSVRWVRLCVLVAIGTSIGLSLIDHLILRSANAMPDAVRYGLQLPVLLICLLVTLRPALCRWYPMAVQVCGPLYGLGSVLLVVYAPPEHTALIGSRLLLVCFFLFFMCGLRLAQALRCNLAVFAMFVAAVAELALPHAAAPDHAHVSVSVGCAAVAVAAQDGFETLARSADEALYAAKHRGRNCSVLLQPAAS